MSLRTLIAVVPMLPLMALFALGAEPGRKDDPNASGVSAKFEGRYAYDADFTPSLKADGSRYYSQFPWEGLLERIPKLVPGDTTRLDTPNDDPALKAEIDWKKQMVVRVTSKSHVPRIVSVRFRDDLDVTPRGRLLAVEYTLEEDLSARPANWGSYSAWIIDRTTERVYFRPVAAPRNRADD